MKNDKYKPESFLKSFKIALNGLKLILMNERNFRVQLFIAIAVSVAGIVLGFSHNDWVAISLLIALVLISEAFNSVIEALADSISHKYDVNIKYAKDVGAGAVLISSIVSVISGVIIIFPYAWIFLQNLIPAK
jgi:diacylglycerol kinase